MAGETAVEKKKDYFMTVYIAEKPWCNFMLQFYSVSSFLEKKYYHSYSGVLS